MGVIGMGRLIWLVVALLALMGIAFSYAAGPPVPTPSGLRELRFFSFFTILTNLLVALAAVGHALPSGHRWHRLATRPAVRTAIMVHITVVALIFHLLLSHMVRPGLSGWIGNMLVHQAVPAAWLFGWIALGPHGGIDTRAPLRWIGFPLLYGLWVLVLGALGDWYPYPFMDVAALGYPLVLRNMAVVGLLFFAIGHGLRWADDRLARREGAG